MRRHNTIIAACLAAALLLAPDALPPSPKLIWNASASVPIGLYVVRPAGALQIGELVAISPPEPVAAFLARRDYLPRGVPLLKHILALPGQTICRRDLIIITVDGIAVGDAQTYDRHGRVLPAWQGCQTLAPNEIFVMNRDVADSLDGRYFGRFPESAVIGRAVPVWTRPTGNTVSNSDPKER